VASGQRVLVVDGLSETGEVLKAVLGPRGLVVDHVRGNHPATAHAGPAAPLVVVIDGDEFPGGHAHDSGWADVPRVVIGSADMPPDWQPDQPFAPARYLQKPFEYAELIQAVEHLLARPAAAAC
jgi:CheY-like chemotaxis protein